MEKDATVPTGFVQKKLPWIIAAGMMVVYGVTLSRWITFSGLPITSKVLGWDWHPVLVAPLHFLLTYPIRWLPVTWQVVGLNLFAAVCSVLALALLARAVAILPHDRTREQRALERSEYSFLSIPLAWVPPLLAVLVCGLQMTFWENTTVATGESLDLLVFAYCVRCLLEYRIAQKDSWLYRMALVYGLGMTNNHAMIAFAPAFLAATVWTMGRGFFRFGFVARTAAFLVAGLGLYLLLPAIHNNSDLTNQGFFDLLRTYLGNQKNTIVKFPPRFLILIFSLTSLLPVLFIGIRWPVQYGDISPAGNLLANLTLHVVHALFLAACLWVAFDPPFSPRVMASKWGQSWAFLPFYYLGALAIGYCSGYLLLLFGGRQTRRWQQPSLIEKAIDKLVFAAVCLTALAVPAGLVYRNLPELRVSQGPFLKQFGETAAQHLPPQGAVVLSDDQYRLFSLYAALYRNGTIDNYVLLDTLALTQSPYHRYLQQHYGQNLTPLGMAAFSPSGTVDATDLIRYLGDLLTSREVYYLHPSFGFFFEYYYTTPRNLVYRLQPCNTNVLENPMLSADVLRQNEEFWRAFKSRELEPLVQAVKKWDPKKGSSLSTLMIAGMYSRALNHLGVEFQRAGNLPKAGEFFGLALDVNTNNPSAYINYEYNRKLQQGQRDNAEPSPGAVDRLGDYGGNLQFLLNMNGPFDEPNTCYSLGKILLMGGNFRQAGQLFQRTVFFNPTNYEARVSVVNAYNALRLPDLALAEIDRMRKDPLLSTDVQAYPIPLVQTEAYAYTIKNDLTTAISVLRAAQAKKPQESGAYLAEVQIYLSRTNVAEALAVYDRQLRVQTTNANAMIDQGVLKLRTGDTAGALTNFSRALSILPQHELALLNRAVAQTIVGNLDAAQRDYETLQRMRLQRPSSLLQVHHGLGEIYFRRKNADKALEHYEMFLRLAPPGVPSVADVKERVKKLKSGVF